MTIQNKEKGHLKDGRFIGATFRVVGSGAIRICRPTIGSLAPFTVVLSSLTLLDAGGADVTPATDEEKASLLNSYLAT